MITDPNSGRRQVDGPIRRVAVNPIAAPPVTATVHEEPVFEYRKPKRRVGFRPGKKLLFVPLVLILLVAGWFGFKLVSAAHSIITKSNGGAPGLATNQVQPTLLKGEGDGRINILVMGKGGAGHDGPELTDTIMVISIDPKTKDVAMLSIPRDLYVKIPGHGSSKINAANADGGPLLTEKVVETVIGVPIHYYVVVDFSGFRQAIDAVGGVNVNVTKALNDPLYPCDSENGKFCPIHFSAGLQSMTGTLALRYARSRETTSDFDRAARQQQVLVALRQKALQLSTLTNPVKLTNLIDAIGSHVKTDLQLGEIQKLAAIAKDIDQTKIVNKVLDTSADGVLIDGSGMIAGAGSIELPKAGTYDYSDIHDFVKDIFSDHYIIDENARIEVQNGSGISGAAGRITVSLKAAHYNVGEPVNADKQYPKTVIYDYTGGKKPYTINYLEQRFGVKAIRITAPSPSPAVSGQTQAPSPEIRIIIGSDYATNTPSSN